MLVVGSIARKKAFENCTALTDAVFPAGIETIGSLIFKGCSLDLVVWVEKGSYAEKYCEEEILEYRYWDGSEPEGGGSAAAEETDAGGT